MTFFNKDSVKLVPVIVKNGIFNIIIGQALILDGKIREVNIHKSFLPEK